METSLLCKSCNNKMVVADVRADKSGTGWVCIKCYEGQHPNIYGRKEGSEEKDFLSRGEQITSQLKKVKYYCSECGYKFQKEGEYSRKCPYCNLYSVKIDKDAETILQETIKETFSRSSENVEVVDPKPDESKIEILDD